MTRRLTPRQAQVLEAFRGRSDVTQAEVAEELGIEEQTVRNHLQGVYTRLGVSTLAGALWATKGRTPVQPAVTPSRPIVVTPRLVRRFWSHVDTHPERIDGCWNWTGAVNADGYGRVFIAGAIVEMAHRLSWVIANGAIPGGQSVLHLCDNPPCVRTSHLFLGTRLDNAMDREAKGRGNHKGRVPVQT